MLRRRRFESPSFAGFRFPPDVTLRAVRWYLRYGLSYRDVEELLAERGIDVDHVTIYRWVQRFTPLVIEADRPCRHSVGDRWFVDETYVRVAGQNVAFVVKPSRASRRGSRVRPVGDRSYGQLIGSSNRSAKRPGMRRWRDRPRRWFGTVIG